MTIMWSFEKFNEKYVTGWMR